MKHEPIAYWEAEAVLMVRRRRSWASVQFSTADGYEVWCHGLPSSCDGHSKCTQWNTWGIMGRGQVREKPALWFCRAVIQLTLSPHWPCCEFPRSEWTPLRVCRTWASARIWWSHRWCHMKYPLQTLMQTYGKWCTKIKIKVVHK